MKLSTLIRSAEPWDQHFLFIFRAWRRTIPPWLFGDCFGLLHKSQGGEKARGQKPDTCVCVSASPKPHPSKPHPCNMPQAKTEVALQFALQKLHCNIRLPAVRISFLPKALLQQTKNCTATLHCTKVVLSCRFPVDVRLPRLGAHMSC